MGRCMESTAGADFVETSDAVPLLVHGSIEEINARLLELEQDEAATIRHLLDSIDELRRVADHYLDVLAGIRHLQAQLRGINGVREERDPDALVHRSAFIN